MEPSRLLSLIAVCVLVLFCTVLGYHDDEDEPYDPYTTTDPKKREPTPCEICKYFVTELQERLDKSAHSKEIIETGHGLDRKKRFKYLTSELRLTEALHEPHICEKILEYNVHAEREGSLRYAKGQSETMSTLHGLVHKGVKVELGIPYELWDKPSAEVTKMQRSCFKLAEDYEEDIEEWYYNRQDQNLAKYICRDRYLVGKDQKCMSEIFKPKGDAGKDEEDGEKKTKKKKKKGKKSKKGDSAPDGGDSAPAEAPEEEVRDEETSAEKDGAEKDEL